MPLSVYQIPLQKKLVRAEFHPKNNSIIILYADGEMRCISSEGKEVWSSSFSCEPISFRINAAGDLIAVLGKEKLFFYNLFSMQTICIDVAEKIQLLEFYKDSVLIGGYQDNIVLVNSNGKILRDIKYEFLIRQFKVIPSANRIILYNQDKKLVCTDMNGNTLWFLENLVIHDEIQVCDQGNIGYFVLDPNDLIQFHIRGEYFFEVDHETVFNCFTSSMDGKYLIILDSEKKLNMFDEKAVKIWEYIFDHNIKKIIISPRGEFFLTIDYDAILNCYETVSGDKERGDFFEIKDDRRVIDKEIKWTLRPGGFSNIAPLNLLRVGAGGDLFGVIGRDGCINFYDEHGAYKYHSSFTSSVKLIGVGHTSQFGFIYGGKEIMIIDFKNDRKKYVMFNISPAGDPIINYYHQKIFVLSREKTLLIYDFEGHLIDTVTLQKEYNRGMSCEAHGVIIYNDREIKGFSGEGNGLFNYPLDSKILSVFYSDPAIIFSTKKSHIFTFDLSSFKGKKKVIDDEGVETKIVSADPLLTAAGKERLHHLDSKLSIISTCKIESPDSHFFMEGSGLYEITRKTYGFYCYNDKREMIWRYISEDKIKESAFMRDGLVFLTEDSVQYIEVKHKEESQKHYSEYLEI